MTRSRERTGTFFCDEGHTPGEHVDEVRQNEWMHCVVELLDVQLVVLESDYRPLALVHVAVVRRTEDGEHLGEVTTPLPPVHLETFDLRLVAPDDA